ncbi:hypothetical protein B0H14DRAFT_274691 [Mycena olivaceomarginata]|nr:hypothetical protein B0H14DRAFT_274691 [Mycena olivaceomarginata]
MMYHDDYASAEELPDWSAWRASLPVSTLLTAGPPRLPEIRVASPSPLLPPYSPYSPSLADESDLEPDLAWIDSDEESDSDTELGSPDSDADLELDFPYSWLADRACFAALDTQLLMHPVQCFAEVCWAEAVNNDRGSMAVADSVSRARAEVQAIVAAGARRDWAYEHDPPAEPPLADELNTDELNTVADTSPQPEEVPFESFDAKFDAYYAYYARGASATPPTTPASTSTTTPPLPLQQLRRPHRT